MLVVSAPTCSTRRRCEPSCRRCVIATQRQRTKSGRAFSCIPSIDDFDLTAHRMWCCFADHDVTVDRLAFRWAAQSQLERVCCSTSVHGLPFLGEPTDVPQRKRIRVGLPCLRPAGANSPSFNTRLAAPHLAWCVREGLSKSGNLSVRPLFSAALSRSRQNPPRQGFGFYPFGSRLRAYQ